MSSVVATVGKSELAENRKISRENLMSVFGDNESSRDSRIEEYIPRIAKDDNVKVIIAKTRRAVTILKIVEHLLKEKDAFSFGEKLIVPDTYIETYADKITERLSGGGICLIFDDVILHGASMAHTLNKLVNEYKINKEQIQVFAFGILQDLTDSEDNTPRLDENSGVFYSNSNIKVACYDNKSLRFRLESRLWIASYSNSLALFIHKANAMNVGISPALYLNYDKKYFEDVDRFYSEKVAGWNQLTHKQLFENHDLSVYDKTLSTEIEAEKGFYINVRVSFCSRADLKSIAIAPLVTFPLVEPEIIKDLYSEIFIDSELSELTTKEIDDNRAKTKETLMARRIACYLGKLAIKEVMAEIDYFYSYPNGEEEPYSIFGSEITKVNKLVKEKDFLAEKTRISKALFKVNSKYSVNENLSTIFKKYEGNGEDCYERMLEFMSLFHTKSDFNNVKFFPALDVIKKVSGDYETDKFSYSDYYRQTIILGDETIAVTNIYYDNCYDNCGLIGSGIRRGEDVFKTLFPYLPAKSSNDYYRRALIRFLYDINFFICCNKLEDSDIKDKIIETLKTHLEGRKIFGENSKKYEYINNTIGNYMSKSFKGSEVYQLYYDSNIYKYKEDDFFSRSIRYFDWFTFNKIKEEDFNLECIINQKSTIGC